MSNYKEVVQEILDLYWDTLEQEDLEKLMILSAYSALEFGDSLRLTVANNPEHELLKEMADEELQTANLVFADYQNVGDHADFLWYFIRKYSLLEKYPELKEVGVEYIAKVKSLPDKVRVMSIVSREQELPGIFRNILSAKDWNSSALAAYKYYLEQHVFLDSHEGGHADMLQDFAVDDRVAEFYEIRLDMYRAIERLFA